jgi:hypothetical protein
MKKTVGLTTHKGLNSEPVFSVMTKNALYKRLHVGNLNKIRVFFLTTWTLDSHRPYKKKTIFDCPKLPLLHMTKENPLKEIMGPSV